MVPAIMCHSAVISVCMCVCVCVCVCVQFEINSLVLYNYTVRSSLQ
jgi:hypothetical protein